MDSIFYYCCLLEDFVTNSLAAFSDFFFGEKGKLFRSNFSFKGGVFNINNYFKQCSLLDWGFGIITTVLIIYLVIKKSTKSSGGLNKNDLELLTEGVLKKTLNIIRHQHKSAIDEYKQREKSSTILVNRQRREVLQHIKQQMKPFRFQYKKATQNLKNTMKRGQQAVNVVGEQVELASKSIIDNQEIQKQHLQAVMQKVLTASETWISRMLEVQNNIGLQQEQTANLVAGLRIDLNALFERADGP